MTLIWKSFAVYFASMVPLVESKGAVVLAKLLRLSHFESGVLSLAGSFTPVPFLLYTKHGKRIGMKHKKKGIPESFRKYIDRYGCWALLVLIAIPFTGMGCWLGAILARTMQLNKAKSAICIFIGDLIAVLLMTGCISGIMAGIRLFI